MIMRKKIISIIAILCIMTSVLVPLAAECMQGDEWNLVNGYLFVEKSAPGHYVYTDVGLFDNCGTLLTYSIDGNWNYSSCSAQDPNATHGIWFWEVSN